MASHSEVGKCLPIDVVDSYALYNPTKVWASVPVDDNDLAKGFRDRTYKELANAVNRASWWIKENFAPAWPFETIAYAGPDGLRYSILALAAGKCLKRLLLPSSSATAEAQAHLVRLTECRIYLHAASFAQKARVVTGAVADVGQSAVLGLQEWLSSEDEARWFPYDRTWRDAKWHPWLVYYTSGNKGENDIHLLPGGSCGALADLNM